MSVVPKNWAEERGVGKKGEEGEAGEEQERAWSNRDRVGCCSWGRETQRDLEERGKKDREGVNGEIDRNREIMAMVV